MGPSLFNVWITFFGWISSHVVLFMCVCLTFVVWMGLVSRRVNDSRLVSHFVDGVRLTVQRVDVGLARHINGSPFASRHE